MRKLVDINVAIDAICNEWCGVSHKDCKHPFNPETDDYYWCDGCETVLDTLPNLPSAELEIILCNDCRYWNNGNCNCPDIRVDCSDYYIGDIVTEEDFYCGSAKRREDE